MEHQTPTSQMSPSPMPARRVDDDEEILRRQRELEAQKIVDDARLMRQREFDDEASRERNAFLDARQDQNIQARIDQQQGVTPRASMTVMKAVGLVKGISKLVQRAQGGGNPGLLGAAMGSAFRPETAKRALEAAAGVAGKKRNAIMRGPRPDMLSN